MEISLELKSAEGKLAGLAMDWQGGTQLLAYLCGCRLATAQ